MQAVAVLASPASRRHLQQAVPLPCLTSRLLPPVPSSFLHLLPVLISLSLLCCTREQQPPPPMDFRRRRRTDRVVPDPHGPGLAGSASHRRESVPLDLAPASGGRSAVCHRRKHRRSHRSPSWNARSAKFPCSVPCFLCVEQQLERCARSRASSAPPQADRTNGNRLDAVQAPPSATSTSRAAGPAGLCLAPSPLLLSLFLPLCIFSEFFPAVVASPQVADAPTGSSHRSSCTNPAVAAPRPKSLASPPLRPLVGALLQAPPAAPCFEQENKRTSSARFR